MKKLIFYFVFLLTSSFAQAQVNTNCDSAALSRKYFQNTMYLKQSFFAQKFEINGTSTPIGFFNSNLRSEFLAKKVSPMTLKELDKSTKNGIISTVISVAGLVPLFFINNKNSDTHNSIMAGVAIGALVVSLPIAINSQNQKSRAIWLYNQDMMSR